MDFQTKLTMLYPDKALPCYSTIGSCKCICMYQFPFLNNINLHLLCIFKKNTLVQKPKPFPPLLVYVWCMYHVCTMYEHGQFLCTFYFNSSASVSDVILDASKNTRNWVLFFIQP